MRITFNKTLLLIFGIAIAGACSEEEETLTFSGLVDVTKSSIQLDKYHTKLLFSTDNGDTWVDYPVVKQGQKYLVKPFVTGTEWFVQEEDVLIDDDYKFDWSTSIPKPNSSSTGDVAEFTLKSKNQIVVKISDECAFSANDWSGTYSAVEDYHTSTYGPYDLTITQDPNDPNKFWLDNFYDSGLEPYIQFSADGTVSFPNQESGGEDITESVGVYKSCTGEIIIRLHYDGGEWHYRLTKQI